MEDEEDKDKDMRVRVGKLVTGEVRRNPKPNLQLRPVFEVGGNPQISHLVERTRKYLKISISLKKSIESMTI